MLINIHSLTKACFCNALLFRNRNGPTAFGYVKIHQDSLNVSSVETCGQTGGQTRNVFPASAKEMEDEVR
jgi:hypothetical protein